MSVCMPRGEGGDGALMGFASLQRVSARTPYMIECVDSNNKGIWQREILGPKFMGGG